MNNTTAAGKFDQVKGKVKQSVGEAVGNEKLANSGAADQVKGAAKEAWGNTKDAAKAVGQDARAKEEVRHSEVKADAHQAGHNIRETVTNAAQNVKDAVNSRSEKTKREHEHA